VDAHRPDGYWYFKNGKSIKLMSLEVELNQKASTWYEGYSYFYKSFDSNSRVLWVVKNKPLAKKILDTMFKSKPEFIVHNFVLLKDILNLGWEAKIFAGIDRDQTVLNLFEGNCVDIPSTCRPSRFQPYMTDRRLTYRIHLEIKSREILSASNSIGLS
ncbi:MAG: hypothetical protein KDD45_06150, partial [Bdellovibrionales bacterium]|nr:hypothetical protein [Bdellovibrionales bacterium]